MSQAEAVQALEQAEAAVRLSEMLIGEIERDMLSAGDPGELEWLRLELLATRRFLAQALRRAEAAAERRRQETIQALLTAAQNRDTVELLRRNLSPLAKSL